MSHPGAAEWYYAVKNYTGTSEEQLTVVAGEPLHLLDDSDNEWWYAISPRTEQAGYIPALFIESTQSRIARVNAVKNKKLLVPSPEDMNSTRTASHQKKLNFSNDQQVFVFDDEPDENGSTLRKRDSENLFAAHGLIRVYAGIWDLEVTYKAIKVGPLTTAEEVIRTAVAKFMSVKNPSEAINPASLSQSLLDSYSLYLVSGMEERKFASDECPLKEFEKLGLDEEQKKLVKFQLKKSVGDIDGIPIRIYSEENLFKTIIVTQGMTVSEAIRSAASKFRGGSPDAFNLRMVAGGKETFPEAPTNLYDIIQANRKEGNGDNQKFFLNRRRVSVDLGQRDQGLLRIYGGPLDLDVAYRALLIEPSTTAEQVVVYALEKYGSRDSPKDYSLSVVIQGAHERTIEKNERPLELHRNFEKEHPGEHMKIMLKKSGAAPKANVPAIRLSKLPMRIYCDFLSKGGSASFKPVLISENMTAAAVVFLAIEKFNIKSNLTIQDYSLYMVNDETGMKRQLLPDEFPLLVKNEVGKKVSCHLTKGLTSTDTFPVRVHGKKIWAEEGYKTIFATRNMTAQEMIGLALEKFKYKSARPELFSLVKSSPDGSDIPGEQPFAADAKPLKEKFENFALVKNSLVPDSEMPTTKIEEPEPESTPSEIDATADDVRKLLASDALLQVGDENLGDVDVGNLDNAFASLSENISRFLDTYEK